MPQIVGTVLIIVLIIFLLLILASCVKIVPQAQALVATYFEPAAASWRGIGTIEGSGLQLRAEYTQYDAGSRGLNEDREFNRQCRCRDVLVGAIAPNECPLFGSACTPDSPCGACMVSTEGSCFHYFQNRRGMR